MISYGNRVKVTCAMWNRGEDKKECVGVVVVVDEQ